MVVRLLGFVAAARSAHLASERMPLCRSNTNKTRDQPKRWSEGSGEGARGVLAPQLAPDHAP